MFSKLRRPLTVLSAVIAGAAAFSGCGLKIGERPNQDSIVQLGNTETACLNGAAKTLGDYFKGATSEQQISGLFNCASNSLQLFEERTRGARQNVYSPGELRKFLETYFLRDFTISDTLLSEFMELKKTLLGGSTSELTVLELHRLRDILDTLRDVSVRLRPYLPLTPSHVAQLSDDDLNTTINAFHNAAAALGNILEEHASPYQFSHMDRLLSEVEKFLQDDDYIHNTAQLRKYLPLFISLKKVFVSPDAQQMEGADWRILLTRGSEAYGLILRSTHITKNEKSLISGAGRIKLMDVSQEAYQFLRDVVATNPNSTMSFCDIYAVIDELSMLYGYEHDLKSLRQNKYADIPIHLRRYFTDGIPQNDADYLWYFKFGDTVIYRGTIKQILLPLFQKVLRSAPTPDRPSVSKEPHLSDYWAACNTAYVPTATAAAAAWPGPPSQASCRMSLVPTDPAPIDNTKYGMKVENLDRLWQVVTEISEGQRYLESIFGFAAKEQLYALDPLSKEEDPASLLAWLPRGQSSQEDFIRALEGLYQQPQGSLSPETIESAQSITHFVKTERPIFSNTDDFITFRTLDKLDGDELPNWTQSFNSLSAVHSIWQVVHMLWDAYAADPNRVMGDPKPADGSIDPHNGTTGGILETEANEFYLDVRELGIAFRLFDPTSYTAAKSRFFEANLFTYAANGDGYMSIAEATDLVAFLVSAKSLSGLTYTRIHELCANWNPPGQVCPADAPDPKHCQLGPKDLFGKDQISIACFNHFLYGDIHEEIWKRHMPNLESYFYKLPPLTAATPDPNVMYKQTFSCILETVARGEGVSDVWMSSGDVDQITALTQYTEALFVRFETEHSGKYLDTAETLSAFPVLKKSIQDQVASQASFLKSDQDYEAVLTYIMAHGSIPSSSDWTSLVKFAVWLYVHQSDYKADRGRVLQVMSQIISTDISGCYVNPNVAHPRKPSKPLKTQNRTSALSTCR